MRGHAERIQPVAVRIAEIGCIKPAAMFLRLGLGDAAMAQRNLVDPLHLFGIVGLDRKSVV